MVMEILGRWEDLCLDDGSRCSCMFRYRKETEKEADDRLSLGEFEVSQLVGVPILLL